MEEQNVNFPDNAEEQTMQAEQQAEQQAEEQPVQAPEEAEAPVQTEEAGSAEAPEEAKAGELKADEEQAEDPFLKYIRQAFAKEHIDEFMQKLSDDQKSFVYVFCSGFETAIGRHIVGVYDTDYIEGYHFTKEVLDSLRIIVKPVEVKDTELKFTIVAQLV